MVAVAIALRCGKLQENVLETTIIAAVMRLQRPSQQQYYSHNCDCKLQFETMNERKGELGKGR